ncbi:MAG TPA: phage head closure protein [Telluria sp.]|jgi:SPP1 family predicted phage head-tail adaptor
MSSFASKLRHLVSIRRLSAGQDGAGQPIEDWTELRSDWADIRTTGGLEAIRAGAVTGTVKASIRTRYCRDVTAAMQIWHDGTVYCVIAVLPHADQVYVDFMCEIVS